MAEPARQFCTFHVADGYYGIDVLRVQEVIREQPVTRVPLAPAVVRGLINLRGQIVMAIDLRRRFGLPERSQDAAPVNLVIRTGDSAVSLLADEIGDVIEPTPDLFEPPPDTLRGPLAGLVTGAYRLEGRLLLALEAERVIDLGNAVRANR
jgi:purine-binding chemotaxis protein CheW